MAGPLFDERGAHGYAGVAPGLRGINVQPWLVDTVRQASRTLPPGYRTQIISTVDPRDTGTRWHPTGRAIDIQIYGPDGKAIPNVGGPNVPGWDVYQNYAAAARAYAQDKYPQQRMTWGGHFNSGTPYDRMHFQVGGPSARDFHPQQVALARAALLRAPQGDGNMSVAARSAQPVTTPEAAAKIPWPAVPPRATDPAPAAAEPVQSIAKAFVPETTPAAPNANPAAPEAAPNLAPSFMPDTALASLAPSAPSPAPVEPATNLAQNFTPGGVGPTPGPGAPAGMYLPNGQLNTGANMGDPMAGLLAQQFALEEERKAHDAKAAAAARKQALFGTMPQMFV